MGVAGNQTERSDSILRAGRQTADSRVPPPLRLGPTAARNVCSAMSGHPRSKNASPKARIEVKSVATPLEALPPRAAYAPWNPRNGTLP